MINYVLGTLLPRAWIMADETPNTGLLVNGFNILQQAYLVKRDVRQVAEVAFNSNELPEDEAEGNRRTSRWPAKGTPEQFSFGCRCRHRSRAHVCAVNRREE